MVLVNVLFRPTRWLVRALPVTKALKRRFSSLWRRCRGAAAGEPSGYEETHEAIYKTNAEMIKILATLMAMGVFGSMIPMLLLLAPVGVWLQLCALRWCDAHDQREFGEQLASHALVQVPVRMFMGLILVLGSGMAVFVMIDLEFGIGPLVLLLCLVAVSMFLLARLRSRIQNRVQTCSVPQVISFKSDRAPREVVYDCINTDLM